MSVEQTPVEEAAARTLLALVKEHRERCDGVDCTLTLTSLLPTFQSLVPDVSAEDLAVFL